MDKLAAIITGIAVLLGIFHTTANAEGWVDYRDDAGCHLSYRGDIFHAGPPVSGQPLLFSGPNDETYFRLIGLENSERLSPGAIKQKYFGDAIPGDVTYERAKGAFLVLSGYREESIFYIRVETSQDSQTICILEIIYPRSDKMDFDQMVTRMSYSFSVD